MRRIFNKIINQFGYKIVEINQSFQSDIRNDKDFMSIYLQCKNYSMTSIERMYSLYNAIEYISKNKILGDVVESGVWRGGSSMLAALTLMKNNDFERNLYLYDTYGGMPFPQNDTNISYRGDTAADTWAEYNKKGLKWCYSSIEETKKNLYSTDYPKDKIVFIQGRVQDTIPKTIPNKISLLRLDTDWYESTCHELYYLYPLLSKFGVLIIDDYGHWKGVKKATDEFIFNDNNPILLNRIDYTGRIGLKIS